MPKFSPRTVRLALLAALALCVFLLAANPGPERIETINHDPGRFHGKEITVEGRVINSFAVMGQGVFLIDDGTGKLWVFSDKFGVPGRDIAVEVAGKVEQGFTFHGKNYVIILRETQQRRDEESRNDLRNSPRHPALTRNCYNFLSPHGAIV